METTTTNDDEPVVAVGETVTAASGLALRISEKAHACLPRVRAHLVALARTGGTTTYGALVRDLELPYPAVGVGRVLDTLAADCARRGEPGLDALVRGARAPEDPQVAVVHAHWSGPTP
ncbi:hypothetical protein [uncultured Nocardioides sp.]|uniref:hypothetical protein n=1 Tax=uncultured Nocardioides sp. TaxID=198441 RepID=UPI00261DF678|nr:hypothetical protein [uncultured Nocardioides sp.]